MLWAKLYHGSFPYENSTPAGSDLSHDGFRHYTTLPHHGIVIHLGPNLHSSTSVYWNFPFQLPRFPSLILLHDLKTADRG